jgi:fucose 4-O-acetylase-like acetyltransferase
MKENSINIRDNSIDIIKGFCIILMMIGHVIDSTAISRHIIYSFHMPVFFIVGGVFLKRFNLKKDFTRLLLPYIIFGSIGSVAINNCKITPPILDITAIDCGWFNSLLRYLWWVCTSLFWGCCGHHHGAPLFNDVPVVAALWFLPAYFVGKNVYLILKSLISSKIVLGIMSLGLSIGAMAIDNYVAYLPFAFNQSISVLFFFYIGNNVDFKKLDLKYIIILVGIWVISLFLTDMNVAFCYLDKFTLLGLLGAIGVCSILYQLAKKVQELKVFGNMASLLKYIGLNSLYIFCLHFVLVVWIYSRFLNRGFTILAYTIVIVAPVVIYWLFDIFKNKMNLMTNNLKQ